MKNAWYYYLEGQRAVGPLEAEDIADRIQKGKLGPYQLMYREGQEEWRPALAFDEFKSLLAKARTTISQAAEWIILKKEGEKLAVESFGPMTALEVHDRLQDGSLNYTDYAWKDGMHQWRRIATLKEFSPTEKPIVKAPPPIIEVAPPTPLTSQDVARFVEVVERKYEQVKPIEPKPVEAAGPDLADSQPPEKPRAVEAKPKKRDRPRSISEKEKDQSRVTREISREQEAEPGSFTKYLVRLYNWRITLPGNWKQIAIVLIVVVVAWYKLFGPSEAPVAPPQAVAPVAQQPNPPPAAQAEDEQMEAGAPQVPQPQAAVPPVAVPSTVPAAPATVKTIVKHHPATKLRIHVENKGGELVALNIETDASPDQTIWLEVIGAAGQITDRSHYFRRWKWSTDQPINMGGELPAGYYRLHATAGDLSSEERFEVGTHQKGFGERLRSARKHASYEYWQERKHLYAVSKQLARVIEAGRPNSAEFDRLARFQPGSVVFYDLWQEIKDITKFGKKADFSQAKGRLQVLQNRIAQLSVYR